MTDRYTTSYLKIYIVLETIRLNCEYYIFNTISGVAPPLISAMSELLKLSIASISISRRNNDGTGLWRHLNESGVRGIFQFMIPAGIDATNNLIYFAALHFTSPAPLQLFWLARLPMTAVLHHVWCKQQRNVHTWSSLIWVCLGLLLFKAPHIPFAVDNLKGNFIGFSVGLSLAASSAASNIASEILTKSGTFWVSQFWLYAWGAVFSMLSYPLAEFMASTEQVPLANKLFAKYGFTVIYIVATALVGITSAVILLKRGNLSKLVGTAASFLASTTFIYYASITIPTSRLAGWSSLGGLVAAFALWWYNYYHKTAPNDYILWDGESDQLISCSDADMEKAPVIFVPTTQDSDNLGLLDVQIEDVPDKEDSANTPSVRQQSLSFRSILNATTFGFFPTQVPTRERVGSGALKLLLFFLPSFTTPGKTKRKLHPTSWLDGLRGTAAVCVVLHHTVCSQFRRLVYGWNGDDQNLFMQLPWARLSVSGHPAVATFFVISGFSLSYGLLKRIHAHDRESFASSLSSSVLRRHFRLFLPSLVVTFTIMLIIHFGLGRGRFEVGPLESFQAQLLQWSQDAIRFANPFRILDMDNAIYISSAYNAVLWTIPVEFRGSMVVYLTLTAFAKLRPSMRLFLTTTLCLFTGWYLLWDIFLFLAGMVLAELHVNTPQRKPNPPTSAFEKSAANSTSRWPRLPSLRTVLRNTYWTAHFLFATYILSTPCEVNFAPGTGDPGYVFLWSLIPSQYTGPAHPHFYFRFWVGVGAVYIVWTLDRSLFLQKIFTTRFVQYLGKISFSLYLMHFQAWMVFGEPILGAMYRISGTETDARYFWGFAAGYVVYFALTVWVADLFHRAVDEKCVGLTKWVYGKLLG